jgi:hypothetical protein
MGKRDARLIAALDDWMRAECDRIEGQIGRECRSSDLPVAWHKASMLRNSLKEREARHG